MAVQIMSRRLGNCISFWDICSASCIVHYISIKHNEYKKLLYRNESYFYSKHGRMSLDPELGSNERLQKRAARFNVPGSGPGPHKKRKPINITKTISNTFTVDGDDIDWTSIHIVGTSTSLEKQYLRLTSVSCSR